MASRGSSLELNKIIGAVLVGGIIALVSGLLGNALVSPRPVEHAAVAVPEGQAGATSAPQEPTLEPVSPLLASADVKAGQEIAKRCLTCHTFDKGGPAKVGPNLWNVVGAKHGHMEGFAYSQAILSKQGPWTYEDLNAFLASPRSYAPGTKMTFAGLSKVQDRADVIAWLRTLSDNPQPLPEPASAAPAEGGGAGTAQAPAAAGEAPAAEVPGAAGEVPAAEVPSAASEAAGAAQQAAGPPGAETGTGAEQGGATAPAEGGSLAAMLANADVAAGEKIAKRCATCHTFDNGGANKVGPNLWNIVGAPHAHRDDFKYSPAMSAIQGAWTYEELDAFITAPSKHVPGTRMSFAGIKDPQQRADLIAWLRTLSDNPQPLP